MRLRDVAPTTRVMAVAIMVSMVVFLDGTVVNLALPATERDIGGGMCSQQWVVDGYLLAVAAMVLPGGAISDLLGRIPVMRFGLVAFGAGCALAATAGSPSMLIAGRLVQGLGGAFLVPGSLALINSSFDRADRPVAIGSWTAWTGTAFAVGPLLGGLAVDFLSWRWIYVLSAIPMAIGFALTFCLRPTPGPAERPRVDVVGAALSAVGLAATVYALIESGRHGLERHRDQGGAGGGGRGIAGVRGVAAPSAPPDGAGKPVHYPQFRRSQPGHRVRLRRHRPMGSTHRPVPHRGRRVLGHRRGPDHLAQPHPVVTLRPRRRRPWPHGSDLGSS